MSSKTQALIEEIMRAPGSVRRDVLDLLTFLKARVNAKAKGAESLLPLAQTAWAADWHTPEEDEAWRDLQASHPFLVAPVMPEISRFYGLVI